MDRVIEISPKYDERKAEAMSDQEREADSFTNTYSLRMRFLEMKFTFAYVSLKDVAADLGGAHGAAGGATKGLGALLALLFVADLVRMLRAKRSYDFTTFKCKQLQKRLPLYRATVEVLLDNHASEDTSPSSLRRGDDLRAQSALRADLKKIDAYTEPSEEEKKAMAEKKKAEEEAKRKEEEEKQGAWFVLAKMAWEKIVAYLAAQIPALVKEAWEALKPRVLVCLRKLMPCLSCLKEPEAAEEEALPDKPPTTEEKIEFLDYLEDKYGELSRTCVVNQDLMDDYFLQNDALKAASE